MDRITIDPEICMGQPTIRGTRLTVRVILKMLAQGCPEEEVFAAYPELEREDLKQILQYAALLADRLGVLSAAEIQNMLGLSTRWQTDAFLKREEAFLDYSEEDLQQDIEVFRRLVAR